jgi:hypothetical protein
MTDQVTCDTPGCDRPPTGVIAGGFHFCDTHRTDTAGRMDGNRAMTLRLPVDLHEHYRQQAFDFRTSMSALIIAALYNDAQTVKADS